MKPICIFYTLFLISMLTGCASNQPVVETSIIESSDTVTKAQDQRALVRPEELTGTWICTQSLELFHFTQQLELQVYSWEGKINNENWELSQLTYKLTDYKSHALIHDGKMYVNNDPVKTYSATAFRIADDIIEWNDGLYLNVKLIKINVKKNVYANKRWNPFTIKGLKEKVRANK